MLEVLVVDHSASALNGTMLPKSDSATTGIRYHAHSNVTPVAKLVASHANTGGTVHAVVVANYGHAEYPAPYEEAQGIRDLPDNVLFRKSIKASGVPILAIDRLRAARPTRIPLYTDLSDKLSGTRGLNFSLDDAVTKAYGEWHQALVDELVMAGFALYHDRDGMLRISAVVTRDRHAGRILADEATPDMLAREQYLFLPAEVLAQTQPIRETELLLNTFRDVARSRGCQPETVLQEHFDKHPDLLKRGKFGEIIRKPAIYRPRTKTDVAPDYLLRANIGLGVQIDSEITDLKLPDEPIIVGSSSRPTFSQYVNKAIGQVEEYRDLLKQDDVSDRFQARFGFRPKRPRAAILVGRTQHEEQVDAVKDMLRDREPYMSVITYDEILDSANARLEVASNIASLLND